MIVLVGIDAFENMIFFESEFDELLEDDSVDWDLREADEDATGYSW